MEEILSVSKKIRSKEILVFNVGGVLLESQDTVIRIWCDAIRSVGLIPDLIKIFENYDESFHGVIIPILAKDGNWTKGQVAAIMDYAKKSFTEINTRVNLNLSDKLLEVKKRGYSLAVITDKNRKILMKSLENIGCTCQLFDFISTSDDGFKKPDSRVLSKVFERYRPEKIMFIGQDYHREYQLAQAFNIDFVAITSPKFSRNFWEAMLRRKELIYDNVPEFIDYFLEE